MRDPPGLPHARRVELTGGNNGWYDWNIAFGSLAVTSPTPPPSPFPPAPPLPPSLPPPSPSPALPPTQPVQTLPSEVPIALPALTVNLGIQGNRRRVSHPISLSSLFWQRPCRCTQPPPLPAVPLTPPPARPHARALEWSHAAAHRALRMIAARPLIPRSGRRSAAANGLISSFPNSLISACLIS